MELKKTLYMNQLFSFYQNLLTDRQREYMSDYYEEDYTLQEIAENYDVSRQAVYDSLRRTEKILRGYEQEMKLVEKNEIRWQRIKQLKDYIDKNYKNDQTLQSWISDWIEDES